MAQNDVLDYIRKTPHNSNVNVVKGMLNNSDGGGSSDFSTAEVTFICPENRNSYGVTIPVVDDSEVNAIVSNYFMIESGLQTPLKLPLYKGKSVIQAAGTLTNIVCTGAVSCENNLYIIVTGDGSISAEADLNY